MSLRLVDRRKRRILEAATLKMAAAHAFAKHNATI